jgi:hypothetical protein
MDFVWKWVCRGGRHVQFPLKPTPSTPLNPPRNPRVEKFIQLIRGSRGPWDHPNPPLFLHGNKYRSCQTRPTGSFYPGLLAPRDRISAARTGTKENCRPRSCGVFRKRAVLKQEYTAVPPHTTRHMVHRRRFLGTPFLLVNVLFYNIRCYWWLTFGSPRLPAQYAPRIVLTQGWKESKTKSHYRKRSSV